MAQRKVKDNDATVVEPPEGYNPDEKKKKVSPEYDRSIKKIASYSGVTRIMKCDNKCGGFDDIVNIYVYKGGKFEDEYKNAPVIDEYMGENSISKQAVRDHGHKDLTFWGRTDEGKPRRKKVSHPVKRRTIKKRGNVKKHK
jgi:hypothetical protein